MKEVPEHYHESDFRGIFVKKYYRKLAVKCAKLLADTPITANQVTIFRGLLIFPAAYLLAVGNKWYSLIGAFLVIFIHFLDWMDGSLARIKKQESKLGMWLSHFDTLMVPLFFFGISIGEYNRTGSPYMIAYGFLIVIAYKWLDDLLKGFRSMFAFSGHAIKEFTSKRKFLSNFFFGDHLIFNTMFLFIFLDAFFTFNLISAYIYICLFYSWLSLAAGFFVFYRKIRKYEAKENKG